ncbi:hypothetical protein A4D02_21790 [Niastella koreensis]|uniref:Glycosyl transferase group 1 n=2 Tax=Niastella koreensis TaxID=354356 RepID=G8THS5_NIAKG|nr:hypothetical protein [Niastella koreensis]AEV98520.1 hypothetical protein Niako_2165 [Niastella koreensis GR20-10]OQP53036.1 hypothetical protein A4D02_21790 [Niastella koreensis]
MKTGIFEMEHYEGAYPVIQLFDMPANQLVIFTDAATYTRFADLFKADVNRFQWEILDRTKGKWHFFSQLYKAAKKHRLDLFYLNTISNNHLFYAWVIGLLRIARVVITVHDINCLFKSRRSAQLRQMVHHIGKKALIKRVQEYNVVSDTMVDYLRETTRNSVQVHNIPGAVFESEQASLSLRDRLHLVVPGSLDKKRRDYWQVFELLKAAEASQLPLHITLLGGHSDEYGQAIIQEAAALKTTYSSIGFYDERVVHQDEFDKQLNAAHFIFIPSVINTAICFSIPETYGLTKSSGNMFDVIKHARPFIAPQSLRISSSLGTSCFKYTSIEHLLQFLQRCMQYKDSYQYWQQQALVNSREYTITKVRAKNPTLFAGL